MKDFAKNLSKRGYLPKEIRRDLMYSSYIERKGGIRMANDRSNYELIKVAVEKGPRDMNDNLARGIRNLTDLGKQFSRGRTQKKNLSGRK